MCKYLLPNVIIYAIMMYIFYWNISALAQDIRLELMNMYAIYLHKKVVLDIYTQHVGELKYKQFI